MLTASRSWFNNLHINTQLMIIITGLNLIDFQTTKILVDRYGFETELNPIMYKAMALADSAWGLLVVKILTVGLMWVMYDAVEHHHTVLNPKRMTYVLGALVAAYFVLITWNFSLVSQSLLS